VNDSPALVVIQFRDADGGRQDVTMTPAQARDIGRTLIAEADRLDPPAVEAKPTPGLGEPGR
jgi:hypothetical protein